MLGQLQPKQSNFRTESAHVYMLCAFCWLLSVSTMKTVAVDVVVTGVFDKELVERSIHELWTSKQLLVLWQSSDTHLVANTYRRLQKLAHLKIVGHVSGSILGQNQLKMV